MHDLLISFSASNHGDEEGINAAITVYDKNVEVGHKRRTLFDFSVHIPVKSRDVDTIDVPDVVARVLESVLEEVEQGNFLMLGQPLGTVLNRPRKI